MNHFMFEIIHQSKRSRARVGRITTPHGTIDTPNFVAVGTNGTLKGVDSLMSDSLGLQLMFCNTYHLMLQPGSSTIAQAGGIHRFSGRKGPIITDSGGFQVFSLMYGGVHDELKSKGTKKHANSILKINEEGVTFRSYRDGSKVELTAERSIQAQKEIGADIIVAFDELPPFHTTPQALRASFERTHRWELRSLAEHKKNVAQQALYAVVHGGIDDSLRAQSAKILGGADFDGYGIGGSLGKTKEQMVTMLGNLMPLLPTEKPNHLLGIGDLPSLAQSIPLGIDTFDSSHPTKAARHGLLFTSRGPLRLLSSNARTSGEAPDPACSCSTCTHYTTAYLAHLFHAHEMTGIVLATIHNLHFMVQLMAQYREQILRDAL